MLTKCKDQRKHNGYNGLAISQCVCVGVEIANAQLCVVAVSYHSTDKPLIRTIWGAGYQASLIPRLHQSEKRKTEWSQGMRLVPIIMRFCTVSRCGMGVWRDRLSSSHFGCVTPIIEFTP